MTVPEGYENPTDVTSNETLYWIVQHGLASATPLYMVIKRSPGMQEILAEKCYLGHAIEIVDALRRIKKIEKAVHPDGGVQAWAIVDEVIEILENRR